MLVYVLCQYLSSFSGFQVQLLGGRGRGEGGWGLYFYICLNPLGIFIVVCVHAGICPVSISIFSSFFFGKSFTMNHLVFLFPEVKLKS